MYSKIKLHSSLPSAGVLVLLCSTVIIINLALIFPYELCRLGIIIETISVNTECLCRFLTAAPLYNDEMW